MTYLLPATVSLNYAAWPPAAYAASPRINTALEGEFECDVTLVNLRLYYFTRGHVYTGNDRVMSLQPEKGQSRRNPERFTAVVVPKTGLKKMRLVTLLKGEMLSVCLCL